MPRIALISSTFPDYQKCGIGIYAGYLSKALAQQGHDVHVVTSAIPEIRPTFEKVTVHKIMESWNPTDVPRLMKLFHEIRPEIIHINHPTAIAGGKPKLLVNLLPEINKAIWKLPVMTTLHEFPNISLLGKIKDLPLILGSDIVTVTNKFYKKSVANFVGRSQAEKIHVVDIGIILDERFQPAERETQRQKYDLKPQDKVLGFVGFLTPPKGFHNLIDAAAPLLRADRHLKILALSSWNLSEPSYRQKVLDRIEDERISSQVIFTGFLEDRELWDSLSAIDLCVFPFDHPVEHRSSGPLRQVIFRGLPTVVYAEDINYDEFGFKHGENIWFTKLKNTEQLRHDILKLLDDATLRNRISNGTRTLRHEFSFDTVSNAMSRLYSQLLARRRPSLV
jgi:glycosyltransferase involved in cell wall biosynthesis